MRRRRRRLVAKGNLHFEAHFLKTFKQKPRTARSYFCVRRSSGRSSETHFYSHCSSGAFCTRPMNPARQTNLIDRLRYTERKKVLAYDVSSPT